MFDLSTNQIILYIVVPVVAFLLFLILLFVILDIKVFSRKRIRKSLNELNKKYKYLNTLLTYQDAQYIQKLDIISRSNLLYTDIHAEYLKKYLDIRDNLDAKVEEVIASLSILVEDKNVRGYKQEFQKNLALFNEYESQVNRLNDELVVVIQPEEDCRKDSLMLKDKYREVRKLYESIYERLNPVTSKFETIFKNIDKRFKVFEEHVDHAEYDEARELLPTLAKVLTQTKQILEVLPVYLEETNELIPQKMGRVLDKYNALLLTDLPLSHLHIEEEMEGIRNVLISLREGYNDLLVKGVSEKIEGLHAILNRLNTSLDLEEDARNKFNDVYDLVMNSYTDLEKNIIKLNNSIPDYEKYYIIDEENQVKLKELSTELDTLSKLKRRVDFYYHGVEKTYYTDLLSKVNDLKQGIDSLNYNYDGYKAYLESLKKDTEYAFTFVNSRYLSLKKCEALLREFNSDNISQIYQDSIDKSYDLLDQTSFILKTRPIDVIKLNQLINELNNCSTPTLEEVQTLANYRSLAIDNVSFINRDRMKFVDVHNLLIQAENLFFSGSYKSCYEMTETIINKIEDKEKVQNR